MSPTDQPGSGQRHGSRQEGLDYVDDSLQALGRLVLALQVTSSINKDFNDTIRERRGVRALAYAVGIPLLGLVLFIALIVNRASRPLLSLFIFLALIAAGLLGVGIYMIYLALWNHSKLQGIERHEVKRAYAVYKPRKDQVDAEISAILESDLIANSRVPKEYLSIQHLRLIARYLTANQASSLEEAIYAFRLDNQVQARHRHGSRMRDANAPLTAPYAALIGPQPLSLSTATGSSTIIEADSGQDPSVVARARRAMLADLHYISTLEARQVAQAHQARQTAAQTQRATTQDREATVQTGQTAAQTQETATGTGQEVTDKTLASGLPTSGQPAKPNGQTVPDSREAR